MNEDSPQLEKRRDALKIFSVNGNCYDVSPSFFEKFGKKHKRGLLTFLKRFLKKSEGKNFSIICGGRYWRNCGWGGRDPSEWQGKKLSEVYFDTHFNFLLCRKNEALACLGFEILDAAEDEYSAVICPSNSQHVSDSFPKDILVIRQIQGVRGAEKYLRYLRWEKLLLQVIIDWAFGNGFEEIRVQAARLNRWLSSQEGARARFKMRYDVTPRRMGFVLSENNEYSFLRKDRYLTRAQLTREFLSIE